VSGPRRNHASLRFNMIGEAVVTHTVAWLHIPKCGGSFGTTLAHYANSTLPADAQMPRKDSEECKGKGAPAQCLTQLYPLERYFKGLLWEKQGNWGDHRPIDEAAFNTFKGNFFGMFRKPQNRVFSSWKFFDNAKTDPAEYWWKIRGLSTMMLAGQAGGHGLSGRAVRIRNTVGPDTTQALKRLSSFKFVGLTEQWDLSICLFHAMFGGECQDNEFVNMRPTVSDVHRNPFENMADPYDDEVYKEAEKLFWQNVDRFNVSRETCEATICSNGKRVFTPAPQAHMKTRNDKFDWPGRLEYDDEYEESPLLLKTHE